MLLVNSDFRNEIETFWGSLMSERPGRRNIDDSSISQVLGDLWPLCPMNRMIVLIFLDFLLICFISTVSANKDIFIFWIAILKLRENTVLSDGDNVYV